MYDMEGLLMEIFTNWIFWVSLSSILFVFAMIGFLSEKKNKGKTASDGKIDSSVNKPTDILDSSTNDTFNLDSPVQEDVNVSGVSEINNINEVDLTNEVNLNSEAADTNEINLTSEVGVVSNPTTIVQNGNLDVSGNPTLGDTNGNQEVVSSNDGSIGENVQDLPDRSVMDNSVERNQVNINTLDVNSMEEQKDSTSPALDVSGGVVPETELPVEGTKDGNLSAGSGSETASTVLTNSSSDVPVESNVDVSNAGGQTSDSTVVSEQIDGSSASETSDKIYDTWT